MRHVKAVPWLELAHDQVQDLNAAQYGDEEGIPRVFKTHAWYEHCPKGIMVVMLFLLLAVALLSDLDCKRTHTHCSMIAPIGCKVVVVLRDPIDVVTSFYHFFEDWFFVSGEVSLDEFAQEFWLERGVPATKMNNASYFVHLASWYEHRNDPNVLMVCFEDLKENLEELVRRVAAFMSTEKVSDRRVRTRCRFYGSLLCSTPRQFPRSTTLQRMTLFKAQQSVRVLLL